MAMNLGTSGKTAPVINVTPLIDVLLVLLIIFMILTPIYPTGEKAVIPQPPEKNPPPDIVQPSVIVLQISYDPAGPPSLRINTQPATWQGLREQLATIYKDRRDKDLFVRADETLDWEPVAQAVGIAHVAGVENVGLITARIEEARK